MAANRASELLLRACRFAACAQAGLQQASQVQGCTCVCVCVWGGHHSYNAAEHSNQREGSRAEQLPALRSSWGLMPLASGPAAAAAAAAAANRRRAPQGAAASPQASYSIRTSLTSKSSAHPLPPPARRSPSPIHAHSGARGAHAANSFQENAAAVGPKKCGNRGAPAGVVVPGRVAYRRAVAAENAWGPA